MWFETLTGLREESVDDVRENLTLSGDLLTSAANGRSMRCGQLEIPTLAELRVRAGKVAVSTGRLRLNEVVGDVQQLHADPANAGAMFQVASQFNLLEMVSPSVTPEDGIGRYEFDRTQGPACAIACGAGTIYRNYFVDVDGQKGQTVDRQIDCLRDVGVALGNGSDRLWSTRNGYALATESGLREISARLSTMSETERDELRQLLRIGVQWDTQVTLGNSDHTVSQAFCSALPVAYSRHSSNLWEGFARLVLDASYEATFLAAILNAARTGSRRLYLTLLGGGAFGNSETWILDAIQRSLDLYSNHELEVAIVSFGSSNASVRRLIEGGDPIRKSR